MQRICSSARDIADARRIHAGILRSGLASDKRVVDQLIQMYGSVGSPGDARDVFEGFAASNREPPDAFLWTAIISAFSRSGDVASARDMFDRMPEPKHAVPTNAMLGAYAKNGHLQQMWSFFSDMRDRSIFSWDTILAAYAANFSVEIMEQVVNKIPKTNAVSWNTIITAYAETGQMLQAKAAFDSSPERSIVSWNAMAKAFSMSANVDGLVQIFERMPQRNRISWTATFFGRIDHVSLEEIKSFFDRMPVREAGTWTVIIVRYSHSRQASVLEELLDRMPQWNVVSLNAVLHSRAGYDLESAMAMFSQLPERDPITWNVMLGAFARLGFVDRARETFDRMPQWHLASFNTLCHGLIGRDSREIKEIFDSAPEHNAVFATTMIVAYAQSGHLGEAEALFDSMPQRTVVTWNAMIAAYAKNSCLRDAKVAFDRMPQRSIDSWNSILSALAKNNRMTEAKAAFDAMEETNAAAWNTMIAAYARSNEIDRALNMFDSMKLEGFQPDEGTFAVVLGAGKADELWRNLGLMADYGVACAREHYNCAVDVLNRAGMFEESEKLLEAMPVARGEEGTISRRESVGAQVLEVEQQSPSRYVLLAES